MSELPLSDQDFSDAAPARPPASDAPAPAGDDGLVDALVRLSVGGVSLGARIARQPLALLGELTGQAGEKNGTEPASTSERVMETAVGAALETGELARRGVRTVIGVNRRVWRMTEPARRPLDALGVTAAVQRPVQAAAQRVEAQVDALQAIGRGEVEASRQRVLGTLSGTIDGIVAYLADNPQVDALIGAQIDKLLPLLAEHPAVERLIEVQVDKILPKLAENAAIQELIVAQVAQILPKLAVDEQIELLIRAQGNKYLDYLNENPEQVRNLVSGQSVGLAGQMLDEVRERTVTADSAAEMLVRNLLRKKPRSDVAEPPENVQARAVARVLPSDYIQRKGDSDGH